MNAYIVTAIEIKIFGTIFPGSNQKLAIQFQNSVFMSDIPCLLKLITIGEINAIGFEAQQEVYPEVL